VVVEACSFILGDGIVRGLVAFGFRHGPIIRAPVGHRVGILPT